MRIQVLSINYAPEISGNAPYVVGLAEYLSNFHDVTVISGVPHYPEWRVAPEWKRWRSRTVASHLELIRLQHYVPPQQDAIRRGAYEASWAARALLEGLRHKADVVVGFVPSLLTAQIAPIVARKHGARSALIVQDLMSNAAAQTGIKGGRSVSKLVGKIETNGFRKADSISTIHQRFADAVAGGNTVTGDKVRVIHNWTHIGAPAGSKADTRLRLGWAPDETVVLHSGNIGLKQNLDTVLETARLANKTGPRMRFVIAGSGNQRARLERDAIGIANLQIVDGVAEEAFPDFLAAADVLLVNERPDVFEMSLPSKLTSYLSVGQPVVAATESGSATAELVMASGGGLLARPGDPDDLLRVIRTLVDNPELRATLASSGQEYADKHMRSAVALKSYRTWIENLHES
jgi:colanic acid biosynthesis glycosyl transferase WcaI